MKTHDAYTVSQLTRLIKNRLEIPEFTRIWVIGEVTDLSVSRAGHAYFSLKDMDGTMLPCTLFAGYGKGLSFHLENGIKIYAMGNIGLYEKRGTYQLNVMQAVPAGEGELALRLKQLKEKLQKEGLFDESRKQDVPRLPERIGLITSPKGAAIRDFLKMVRNIPTLSVVLYPSVVQGSEAAPALIRSLRLLQQREDVDVIVLTRGGGSEEDLLCFSDEELSRAISDCPKPVISAVGHEKDTPISDLVADLRLPTPTAAGRFFREGYDGALEMVQRRRESLVVAMSRTRDRSPELVRFTMLCRQLQDRLERFLPDRLQQLDQLTATLTEGTGRTLRTRNERLQQLSRALHPDTMTRTVNRQQERMRLLTGQLTAGIRALVEHKEDTLKGTVRELNAVNPMQVLERGYTATFDKERKQILRSIHQIQAGDTVQIRFVDGFALSHVLYTERDKE